MLHGFLRTPFPSLFESSPHASGFDRMPRLCYILADGLHLCYGCSLLSFHHHRFCGYFSCIILPNLRILVPDRIVPFDQALLASSCHDFSSLSIFFFFFFGSAVVYLQLLYFPFLSYPLYHLEINIFIFSSFLLFLVCQGVSLKSM